MSKEILPRTDTNKPGNFRRKVRDVRVTEANLSGTIPKKKVRYILFVWFVVLLDYLLGPMKLPDGRSLSFRISSPGKALKIARIYSENAAPVF
jgi:hypothetical protein